MQEWVKIQFETYQQKEVKQTLMATNSSPLPWTLSHFSSFTLSSIDVFACHHKKTQRRRKKNTIKMTYSARWFRNKESNQFSFIKRDTVQTDEGNEGDIQLQWEHLVARAFVSASGKTELSFMISIKNIHLIKSTAVGKATKNSGQLHLLRRLQ